jgi:hypothetical protein
MTWVSGRPARVARSDKLRRRQSSLRRSHRRRPGKELRVAQVGHVGQPLAITAVALGKVSRVGSARIGRTRVTSRVSGMLRAAPGNAGIEQRDRGAGSAPLTGSDQGSISANKIASPWPPASFPASSRRRVTSASRVETRTPRGLGLLLSNPVVFEGSAPTTPKIVCFMSLRNRRHDPI